MRLFHRSSAASTAVLQLAFTLPLLMSIVPSEAAQDEQLNSRCRACDAIAASFQRGLERTARDNFGGGNTNWEETRLGTYALSETRLVDITERLCKDKGDLGGVTAAECHAMLEQIEEDIERFWFGPFKANFSLANLRDFVCVNGTNVCCGRNRWGPECSQCPDCSGGRGDCNGNGTRTGTGACDCHPGYAGPQCSDCAKLYYRSAEAEDSKDSEAPCKACSPACRSACTGPSASQCDACADGYQQQQQLGESSGAPACIDINECQTGNPCIGNRRYCENLPGSYRCGDCDQACSSCSGPGPTGCTACSPGFEPATSGSAGCQDVNECSPDSPHCTGPNERCVNLPGSYRCDCQPGFQRSGSQCVPKPSPSRKPAGSKQAKKGPPGNKKAKPPKLIWTVAYTLEFAKFFAAIVGLALFAVAVKGRPLPVTAAAFLAGWYLCRQSSVLDRVYLHGGRR